MKANLSSNIKKNEKAYSFLIPFTMAIVVSVALLVTGAFAVGEITDALESSYSTNTKSGSVSSSYDYPTGTITKHTNTSRNVTLDVKSEYFDETATRFYILTTGGYLEYNLSVNGHLINASSGIGTTNKGHNVTLADIIADTAHIGNDHYLTFSWNCTDKNNTVNIAIVGTYYVDSDWRSPNQNGTISLMGNITDGFSDVVDIEIVVMIITGLSMAIFAIMGISSRKTYT